MTTDETNKEQTFRINAPTGKVSNFVEIVKKYICARPRTEHYSYALKQSDVSIK